MPRVAILANCQGGALRRLMEFCLEGWQVTVVSNTARAGQFTTADEAAAKLAGHDIIVHQALSKRHGVISNDAIQAAHPRTPILRFAYILNSGIGSLGYAPQSQRNSYGEVIGEAILIGMINAGFTRKQIEQRVAEGDYAPSLPERFAESLAEMARREQPLELHLAPYIAEHYREQQLFLTHNHPTLPLLAELLRQLVRQVAPAQLAGLQARLDRFPPKLVDLHYTGAPISPYDAHSLGYRFGFHSDWQVKQAHLIRLVWACHKKGKPVAPSVLKEMVRFPDVIDAR